jgi:tRNA 2-thiouridine synthesizing protein B
LILHTLNAHPSSQAFSDCLRLGAATDAILLSGDGVYAALDNTAACHALLACGAQLYVLEADAGAAGITQRLNGQVQLASYDDFAALTERFERQLAWY